jgi:hypothetical protein
MPLETRSPRSPFPVPACPRASRSGSRTVGSLHTARQRPPRASPRGAPLPSPWTPLRPPLLPDRSGPKPFPTFPQDLAASLPGSAPLARRLTTRPRFVPLRHASCRSSRALRGCPRHTLRTSAPPRLPGASPPPHVPRAPRLPSSHASGFRSPPVARRLTNAATLDASSQFPSKALASCFHAPAEHPPESEHPPDTCPRAGTRWRPSASALHAAFPGPVHAPPVAREPASEPLQTALRPALLPFRSGPKSFPSLPESLAASLAFPVPAARRHPQQLQLVPLLRTSRRTSHALRGCPRHTLRTSAPPRLPGASPPPHVPPAPGCPFASFGLRRFPGCPGLHLHHDVRRIVATSFPIVPDRSPSRPLVRPRRLHHSALPFLAPPRAPGCPVTRLGTSQTALRPALLPAPHPGLAPVPRDLPKDLAASLPIVASTARGQPRRLRFVPLLRASRRTSHALRGCPHHTLRASTPPRLPGASPPPHAPPAPGRPVASFGLPRSPGCPGSRFHHDARHFVQTAFPTVPGRSPSRPFRQPRRLRISSPRRPPGGEPPGSETVTCSASRPRVSSAPEGAYSTRRSETSSSAPSSPSSRARTRSRRPSRDTWQLPSPSSLRVPESTRRVSDALHCSTSPSTPRRFVRRLTTAPTSSTLRQAGFGWPFSSVVNEQLRARF